MANDLVTTLEKHYASCEQEIKQFEKYIEQLGADSEIGRQLDQSISKLRQVQRQRALVIEDARRSAAA